jgi:hypothetical protein
MNNWRGLNMFGWLFGKKKKVETKVTQKVEVTSTQNHVVQSTIVVNQRGAKAKGDLVGGNKITTYQSQPYVAPYDPLTDMLSPLNPLSPLSPMNPANRPEPEPNLAPSHTYHTYHSHDSGRSYHGHDSSSSSSYDSGSSHDSGSSYSSSSSSD